MTAMRYETATDKDHIADAVNASQFTDRIENHNIFIMRLLLLELRACRNRKPGFAAEMNHFCRAQEFTRRYDQARMRMRFAHCTESLKDRFFLAAMCRASQENTIILFQSHTMDDGCLFLRLTSVYV